MILIGKQVKTKARRNMKGNVIKIVKSDNNNKNNYYDKFKH